MDTCRLWTSQGARYAGFLGQWRPLAYNLRTNQDGSLQGSNNESTASTSAPVVLPYDITEGPVPPRKTDSARRRQLEHLRLQSRLEYPVLFDNTRWAPLTAGSTTSTGHKFFDALVKPSVNNKLILALRFLLHRTNYGCVVKECTKRQNSTELNFQFVCY